MAKKLSPWCKEAKKKMIDMDLEVNELASRLYQIYRCFFRGGVSRDSDT